MTVIGYQQSEANPNGIDFNKDGLYFKWNSDSTGAMQTIQCNSIDEFYQLQKDNDAHFFQVVRADKPVREYYDIDYILQEDEKISDHEFVSDFVAKRCKLITLLNIPGKYFLYPNDLIVLTAHSDKKLSFHIYSKKTGFKNTETHKQFSDLLKKYIPAIDLSVYSKNRAMRLIGNSKFGQNRPLIPHDDHKYSVADTLIELNPLNTKGRFNSVNMVEFVSVEKDGTHAVEIEQVEDISKKKFMKNFLAENPWFKLDLPNKKLRRENDGTRRPCLVNLDADHGTENMSINQYNGIVYVQCFQHKGKYKIPGQKEPKIKEPKIKEPKTKKTETENDNHFSKLVATEYPVKNFDYYWNDLNPDIEYLNSLKLHYEEYYDRLLPKVNQVVCYITDLQCFMIRSSHEAYNQLQKKIPVARNTGFKKVIDNELVYVMEPFTKLFNNYLYNDLIYQYHSKTFNPDPNFHNPNVVNTWTGFKTTAETTEPSNLEKILYHFREVWCSGNQEHYDWLINCWFKPLFENPHILTGTAIVLWSEQGAGKNIIIDEFLIPYIFGENQSSTITGISKITQKHNTIIEDKIFCNVNELPRLDVNGKNRDMFDALKGLLTDKYITIEPKGIGAYKIPNYTRYIFCSNHKESLFIEAGDRRFLCLEVSSKHKGDFEYFDSLKQAMNQDSANAFFKYCLEYKLQGLNVRKIPLTNLKSDMIKNCSTSSEQFCLEIKDYIKLYNETKFEQDTPQQHKYEQLELPQWMSAILDIKDLFVSAVDLYNCYRHFCEDNGFKPTSSTKFGLIIKTHFEKKRYNNGMKYKLF